MDEMKDCLRILTYPNSALRRKAESVEEVDDELTETAWEMVKTMYLNEGVGLAATQVGLGKKLIVVNPTGEKEDERILVNPSIVERRGDLEGVEGCLSVPGVCGTVHRSTYIRVIAYDLDGSEVEIVAEDFFARVLQHEIDHLEGMLLIDRMTPESRIEVRELLKALEEGRPPANLGESVE